jgi:hypothetical protein
VTRTARFTKADLRRAMQAAKAEGFDRVELVDSPEGLKIVCERSARAKTDAPESVVVEELV